jgi:hypothetical protein
MWLLAIWLQLNTVMACHWALFVTVWNSYQTTMTWLRWGITLEWTALPYDMYKKYLNTFTVVSSQKNVIPTVIHTSSGDSIVGKELRSLDTGQ